VSAGKLHPPTPRKAWIRRDRLIASLIDAADKKLILLEAPAGYGKTILLAQWAHADTDEPRPVAYVTLDPGDNDLEKLWTYIIEALRRLAPALTENMLALLATEPDRIADVVVPRLIGELAVLPGRLVLVLDDYHHIRDRSCHGSIDRFINDLPRTVQVVIATRSDPPLQQNRTRPSPDVLELRAPALRFDRNEAEQLLNMGLNQDLGPHGVEQLMERTEGWPAGLYLAVLSLKDRPNPKAFVEEFAGNNRLVVDYLTAEVLEKQSDRLRRFLVRTSILDRLSPSACDAVVGTGGSEEILDHLVSSNLFVVPIDENHHSYRYHRLFKDLLRGELHRSESDLIPELHRRASRWHRKWGLLEEAIAHAAEANDIPTLRELIASNWFRYWRAGRIQDIRSWLQEAGQDRIEADPVLALVAAWMAGFLRQTQEFESRIEVAARGSYDGPLPDGFSSLESGVALVRSLFGYDGIDVALAVAQRSEELEHGGSRWRPLALSCLGYYLYLSGDRVRAVDPLEELTAERGSSADTAVFAMALLAMMAADEERREEAEKLASDARALAQEQGLHHDWIAAAVQLATGLLFSQAGDLISAETAIQGALRSARRSPWFQPWLSIQALLELATVDASAGNKPGAQPLLEEANLLLSSRADTGVLKDRYRRLTASLVDDHRVVEEPLTDREATVLELLPTPLTQREIGDELYLSINTVKSHTRAVFRKLRVNSRPEAVDKARQLGLL
jgi:LuxR family transcriptional regulator, maltose regulon positive regulatory protein